MCKHAYMCVTKLPMNEARTNTLTNVATTYISSCIYSLFILYFRQDCINGYTQCLRNVCTRDPDVFRAAIKICREEERGCLEDCFTEMYDH